MRVASVALLELDDVEIDIARQIEEHAHRLLLAGFQRHRSRRDLHAGLRWGRERVLDGRIFFFFTRLGTNVRPASDDDCEHPDRFPHVALLPTGRNWCTTRSGPTSKK